MNETINSHLLNDNIIETNDDTISTGSTGSTKECWICKEIVEMELRRKRCSSLQTMSGKANVLASDTRRAVSCKRL